MAASSASNARHVVPRWRLFKEALAANELAPSAATETRVCNTNEFLSEREAAWLEHGSLPFAVDLVSAATMLGVTTRISDNVRKAANRILEAHSTVSSVARSVAEHVLGIERKKEIESAPQTKQELVVRLANLKAKRISQPRNAFVWTDLARLYTVLGQTEPAGKALHIALLLAPTERFVLRSAARYLHHVKKYEQAVRLLRENSRTPYDPWLVAAEIAASCAAERVPKFVKVGRQLMESDISPFHTSELACALGNLELASGKERIASKRFREALREPTDNALAHVAWACKRLGMEEISRKLLQTVHANEALAWNDFHDGKWSNVLVDSKRWWREEAFSARPPLLSSSVAAGLLDKPDIGEEIAREGLRVNPGHPTLVNNLAFSMALQGKGREALLAIRGASKINRRIQDSICLLATTGMAFFRLGDAPQGRKYYEASIGAAHGAEHEAQRTAAHLYFARERLLLGDKGAVADFKRAYTAARRLKRTNIPFLAAHLADSVEKASRKLGIEVMFDRDE